MKILITTFAIVLMLFSFAGTSAIAAHYSKCPEGTNLESVWTGKCVPEKHGSYMDELRDPDQAGDERDIADSGDEGSTSAASADDQ